MNLTANIPVDFTNMKECSEILRKSGKSLDLIHDEIKIGTLDQFDFTPMTQEEQNEAIKFITNLNNYIKSNPV